MTPQNSGTVPKSFEHRTTHLHKQKDNDFLLLVTDPFFIVIIISTPNFHLKISQEMEDKHFAVIVTLHRKTGKKVNVQTC